MKTKKYSFYKEKYGYYFILPYFIVFSIFILYPLVYTFYLSMTRYDGFSEITWVGFQNYGRLIKDQFFWKSFVNTWRIWIVNIIPQIGIALFLASWFSDVRYRIKGSGFFRAVFYLPNLVTAASVALLFNVLLDWQHGAINQLMISMGILKEPIHWLGESTLMPLIVSFIQWWLWFGHTLILIMAGILGIDPSYYEAAVVDGANRWQIFIRITLPLLKPIMLYVIVTSLIGGMQIFDIPFVLTDGKGAPASSLLTMVVYLYNQGFQYNNFGYGAAIAYALFLVILLCTVVLIRFYHKGDKEYE